MEENNTPVVEETLVDETVEEVTAEPQETENQGEPTEEIKPFMNITYNKEELALDQERAIELAQKGMNYDKVQEKLSSYENNKLLKWAEEYSKKVGYEDHDKFLEAVTKEEEAKQYQQTVDKYKAIYGEEAAEKMAEMEKSVSELKERNSKADEEEKKNKEYSDTISWYNDMKEQGVFTEVFNADSIPQEVWDKKAEGETLKNAYMDYTLRNMKTIVEQNTLKNINQKQDTSTGSIKEGNQATVEEKWTKDYINKMVETHGDKWIDSNFDKVEKSGYFGKF